VVYDERVITGFELRVYSDASGKLHRNQAEGQQGGLRQFRIRLPDLGPIRWWNEGLVAAARGGQQEKTEPKMGRREGEMPGRGVDCAGDRRDIYQ
jgi:hypothetical protein